MADFLRGADRVIANVKAVDRRAELGAVRGLGVAAQNVLNVSNQQVPHETGDLERDGAIAVDETDLLAGVGYGRDPEVAKYAEVQHEDLTFHHDEGRNAKFLENAFNQTRNQNAAIIAQNIKSEMGS